jgi:hypothetical protein
MVRVMVSGGVLAIEVEGAGRDLTRRNRLEFPLTHVTGARVDSQLATRWFRGFRIAGADVPQMLRPGLFYRDGNVAFWDVRNPDSTVVIDLTGEPYTQLVIEVPDPEGTAAAICSAAA